MCNVIILLNKPLEEDIPFTTRSKAGRFRGCFMFTQYKQTCYWLKGKITHPFLNGFAAPFMHFRAGGGDRT